MAPPDPKLTGGERAELAWLTARMAKRGIAAGNSPTGDVYQGDLQRKFNRITDRAADRTGRERDAMARQLETAQRAADDAKAKERTTRGDEKRAAREERRQAERRLRTVQQAARRYNLT